LAVYKSEEVFLYSCDVASETTVELAQRGYDVTGANHGTPVEGGMRLAVYPITPEPARSAPGRCSFCERYLNDGTAAGEQVPHLIGLISTRPRVTYICASCDVEDREGQFASYLPPGFPIEDTLNYRGESWEIAIHPSEARHQRAMGQWVPEGYTTEIEELHAQVQVNALERKLGT
jgi:hypothetical protein